MAELGEHNTGHIYPPYDKNVTEPMTIEFAYFVTSRGLEKKWRLMQTGENSIIEARILYHSDSYT